jgi:hypothetical protein
VCAGAVPGTFVGSPLTPSDCASPDLTRRAPIGVVNSIALAGTPAAPNFSWTPPAQEAVQGDRAKIFDSSLVVSGWLGGMAYDFGLLGLALRQRARLNG